MTVRTLVCSLALVALVVEPLGAADLDFSSAAKLTFGTAGLFRGTPFCAVGTVDIAADGNVLGGDTVRCDGASFPIRSGRLVISSQNHSVIGTIDDGALVGHMLPAGDVLVAVESFGPASAIPGGRGITVLIDPADSTSFAQADLDGYWRMAALSGGQYVPPAPIRVVPSDVRQLLGSIHVDATGNLGVGLLPTDDSSIRGNVSINSSGQVSGFVRSRTAGEDQTIIGYMTPDKNLVAGVTIATRGALGGEPFQWDGMLLLQRWPTVDFVERDLAGTWSVVALQVTSSFAPTDSAWFNGTVGLDADGHVTAGSFTDSAGVTRPVISSLGRFQIDGLGMISGIIRLRDGPTLAVSGAMSEDKQQVIGITNNNTSTLLGAHPQSVIVIGIGTTFSSTSGLVSMVRQGPPPPTSTLQFHAAAYRVNEGGTATVRVDRSGATTTEVTVEYTTFAYGPTGLPAPNVHPASGVLTFQPGQTAVTFDVTTNVDNMTPGNATVYLGLSFPTNGAVIGARSGATLTVVDATTAVQFEHSLYTMRESRMSAIRVVRSGVLATTAKVGVNVSGISAGVDFEPVSQMLTFAPGVTTRTVTIPLVDTRRADGNRSVLLTLSALSDEPAWTILGPRSAALVTILDDDEGGRLTLDRASYSVREGSSLSVTIRRQAVTGRRLAGNVSAGYQTDRGNGTVTFNPGETSKVVRIPIPQDTLVERPETFLVTLGEPTGGATLGTPATATVTVQDDDLGGVIALSGPAYSVNGAFAGVMITVRRSGGAASNVSVLLTTADGTAIAGTDYGAVSIPITFGANQKSASVVIPILRDAVRHGNKTFRIRLSEPGGGATLGSPASATVTIVAPRISAR